MRVEVLLLAVSLTVAAGPTGQGQKEKKTSDKPVITVTGCVDGSWLHVRAADPGGSYTERYRLRGSKQLLKEIAAQYNGHLLEVTGAVTDTANTTHRGKTVQVGKKTKIYTGAKEIPDKPSGDDPTLDVASFVELKESCR
jgi:hypothetical protein